MMRVYMVTLDGNVSDIAFAEYLEATAFANTMQRTFGELPTAGSGSTRVKIYTINIVGDLT